MAYVAESGHWYDREGNPRYEVENKSKGGMRPTRITDAKKLELVPSVTAVLKILDKPALTNWKIEGIIKAAMDYPFDSFMGDESMNEAAYIAFLKDKAFGADTTGRDRGTEIHGAIEEWFKGDGSHPLVNKYIDWCNVIHDWLTDKFGDQIWIAEESFSSPLGYGGKVDLYCPDRRIVVDFKTKDFSKGLPKAYDENGMQLVAYDMGLFPLTGMNNTLVNLFIDRDEPKIHAHIWNPDDYERLWDMFYHSLLLWQQVKKYDSSY